MTNLPGEKFNFYGDTEYQIAYPKCETCENLKKECTHWNKIIRYCMNSDEGTVKVPPLPNMKKKDDRKRDNKGILLDIIPVEI